MIVTRVKLHSIASSGLSSHEGGANAPSNFLGIDECHSSYRDCLRGGPIPPPPPIPIFTWTGVYLGGQIGYGWGSDSGFDPVTGTALVTSVGGNPSGVVGGAHVGYQYQINQWVLGLEGSVDGTGLTNTAVAAFLDGTNVTASTSSGLDSRQARRRLGPRPDLRHRRCRFRRFRHQFLARKLGGDHSCTLRCRKWRLDHPGGLDRWRRRPICGHRQLVGFVASTGLLAGSPRPFAGAFLNADPEF